MINIEGFIEIDNLPNLLDKIVTDKVINNLQEYINNQINVYKDLDLEDDIELWISDFVYDELGDIILKYILDQNNGFELKIDSFTFEYDFLDEIVNYLKPKLNLNESTSN
jgi:hypothetical protein